MVHHLEQQFEPGPLQRLGQSVTQSQGFCRMSYTLIGLGGVSKQHALPFWENVGASERKDNTVASLPVRNYIEYIG